MKSTIAMSRYFSIPSTTQFREVTPFNNKETCLSKTEALC